MKHLARNLSPMTREAEQRELQLRDDMEKLRIQQEQTLGTLDTKMDTMMERRTQAIMDRLDGLLGIRSGSKNGESNSGEPSREPRVKFIEQTNRRRAYGSTRGRGSSSSHATGENRPRGSNIRGSCIRMKLHFEEEDLSERQECSALTNNLEGTALNSVMAKKQN